MKQKVEIEVDVPDDMEIKCQGTRNDICPVFTPDECTGQLVCNVLLRRREPVRESRWRRVPLLSDRTFCMVFSRRDEAFDHAQQMGSRLERLDYEDGKLVSVELEEVGDG